MHANASAAKIVDRLYGDGFFVHNQPVSPLESVEISQSYTAQVGDLQVRRALPRATRRTIGAWCFIDHLGPVDISPDSGADTPPHPHMGLHTVTWPLEGEVVHHDSLGTEQLIRPGELNVMTAGHGIAHSEEGFGRGSGRVHAVQLWVAQPEATRHGGPAFEHHGSLPTVEVDHATCTILVGHFAGATSPARRDTQLVGVDLRLRPGRSTLPLVPSFEYGAVAMAGQIEMGGIALVPGQLAYLGSGHDEVALDVHDDARMILIGGEPFESRISMFWNFVARTHDEIDEAVRQWQADDGRFGHVPSSLPRIPSPRPLWQGPAR
jgi:quercetin 2,3-dioxygenase